MCLSIAVNFPQNVLAFGRSGVFEWVVTHNDLGYRCGYVRVPRGHPWHGKDFDQIDADVHGGLTFAEADAECDKGSDDGWWIGFDCAHAGDARDPALVELISNPGARESIRLIQERKKFPVRGGHRARSGVRRGRGAPLDRAGRGGGGTSNQQLTTGNYSHE